VWSPSDSEVHLVAGRHRLAAAIRLGWDEIDANFLPTDTDEIDRQILEIVENVHRHDLSKEQRDQHLRRYAELLEAKEAKERERQATVHNGQKVKVGHNPEKTASKIAKATGLSRQTVARAIGQIKKKPTPPDARARLKQEHDAELERLRAQERAAAQERIEREAKEKSRPARWSDAAARAIEAIEQLQELQGEYQIWQDGLPENLQTSAVAEKLDAIVGIDFDSALAIVQEAADADLPLGFGRD
jgi:ParB-like chromosome segregation protein Spo0J